MIEVGGVTFRYPGQSGPTLQHLSFAVTPGDFLVVLGKNGSGKSTLAKLLNGLLLPSNGDVIVDGLNTRDPNLHRAIRQKVGLLFSNPDNQLVSSIVEEDVAFGPENLGVAPVEIEKRVHNALQLVSMEDFRRYPPHLLSGGQKQRVAIAGLLALEPNYMVLDEPTSMLDPRGREDVINTLFSLNRDEKKTIILITHFIEEALVADRVLVLGSGTVAMDGTPEQILIQTDELHDLGLEPPDLVLLAEALAARGYEIPTFLQEKDLLEYIITRKTASP